MSGHRQRRLAVAVVSAVATLSASSMAAGSTESAVESSRICLAEVRELRGPTNYVGTAAVRARNNRLYVASAHADDDDGPVERVLDVFDPEGGHINRRRTPFEPFDGFTYGDGLIQYHYLAGGRGGPTTYVLLDVDGVEVEEIPAPALAAGGFVYRVNEADRYEIRRLKDFGVVAELDVEIAHVDTRLYTVAAGDRREVTIRRLDGTAIAQFISPVAIAGPHQIQEAGEGVVVWSGDSAHVFDADGHSLGDIDGDLQSLDVGPEFIYARYVEFPSHVARLHIHDHDGRFVAEVDADSPDVARADRHGLVVTEFHPPTTSGVTTLDLVSIGRTGERLHTLATISRARRYEFGGDALFVERDDGIEVIHRTTGESIGLVSVTSARQALGIAFSVTDDGSLFTWEPIAPDAIDGILRWHRAVPDQGGPFCDVARSSVFADAIEWMASTGITTGTGLTSFSPGRPVSRGEIAAFLWRAAGRPDPTATAPFTDLPPGAYYANAVAWLSEQGITNGVDDHHFAPDAHLTRGEIAAFLWRAAGRPDPTATAPFTDLPPGAYYADAVAWLSEQGITNGVDDHHFAPDAHLTRGEIAAFLWRAAGRPDPVPT